MYEEKKNKKKTIEKENERYNVATLLSYKIFSFEFWII